MKQLETGFLADLTMTLERVQGAWKELLDQLDLRDARPYHISQRLEATSTLTWKLVKSLRAESVVEGARYLPGKSGCNSLLAACERAGASGERLAAVRAALDDYRGMVRKHAGSRQTLHSMLLAQQGAPAETDVIQLRKHAFQANSANLGVRAKTRVTATFVTPGDRPGYLNTASTSGMLQFQQLTRGVRWPVLYLRGRLYMANVEDSSPDEAVAMPELVEEFSTSRFSDLEAKQEEDGTSFWLSNERLGLSGAADCLFEWRDKQLPSHEGMSHMVDLKTPVEALVFTLLYHRDIEVEEPLQTFLYSRMQGPVKLPFHEQVDYHMPVPLDFAPFDDASRDLGSAHVPMDEAMIERFCEKRGWRARDFRGWRLTMPYPPIPTLPGVFLRVR